MSVSLDVAVLPLSVVFEGNSKVRIDSGFFSKAAVEAESRVCDLPTVKLGSLCTVFRKGIFDIKASTYVEAETGVPFIRIGDLKEGLIRKNRTAWISHEAHLSEAKTALQFGDLVLSKTAYPAASLVNVPECNVSQDTIAARLSPEAREEFSSGYIIAFLNCRFGYPLMARRFQGNVQQHLSLEDGKSIPIPILSQAFQLRVHELLLEADETLDRSVEQRHAADNTLLRALGLSSWNPPEPLTFTAVAAVARAAGRLDSEHFQGKFQLAQEQVIAAGATALTPLDDFLSYLTNGHTPLRHDLSVGDVPFLTAEHIQDFVIDYDTEKRILTRHHVGELARTAINKDDVLVTIKGRVGNAAIVESENPFANINQDVALLRFQDDAPPVWYIVSFLNSMLGKLEVEKWSTGQINPFLGLSNLRKIEVPIFAEGFMREVAAKTQSNVRAALATAYHAKTLLRVARRSVEIAIEEDEDTALEFIEQEGVS